MKNLVNKEIVLNPEPGILIESLRDIGYSFKSALADIIDNSITAEASSIEIYAVPADKFTVAIIDNGKGLTRDELLQAMRLGSSNPRAIRKDNDLGRFGLGLKTASFSQCRKLTVATKNNGTIAAFSWDLNKVVSQNCWNVTEIADYKNIPYKDYLKDDGTLVLWEDVDRLTGERGSGRINYERVISEAQDHLALVFHRYLSGEKDLKHLSISFNGRQLVPLDPFNSSHKATQVQPKEEVIPGVTLQAYTLPHKSCYKDIREYEKYGLVDGYLKNQGVYIYRAKRLILYGTWFGLAKKTNLTQLCRVKIDIDNSQDELWKIDVKKVSAQMPEAVRERVKSLVNTMGAPSKRVYKRRGVKLTSKEFYPVWQVEHQDGLTQYKINRSHPLIKEWLNLEIPTSSFTSETFLSLIESSFPKDALFYDLGKDEDSVGFPSLTEDQIKELALIFFNELKSSGKEEDVIISIMKNNEAFSSNWNATIQALGITEEE